ncbi:SusC/RagA family TonB-linked outer membrane protein [Seonamhaeicola sp.]|uniref:SusC/RagA family TonB-linked outer membrane protein n=1 Tax=Seonamhaeicola sp. TaxID=1912245 RepID=UPI002609346F|nr:SusC/RagA family TonB-linked outer membrane protein [Seonamhaeicola sp.]
MKNNYTTKGRSLLFCMVFSCLLPLFTNAIQQLQIHGVITDTSGNPLAGVHVMVETTNKGVVSNFDGSYSIKASTGDTLVFSALGFVRQTVTIKNGTAVNVQLEEDITQLDTVTLNAGYYTVKDKERTGSIAKIAAKTIEQQPVNNPMAAMQGHLTGVNIVQTTGVPGGGYQIDIRGKNFINGGTDPLFIVDGVPYGGQSLESTLVSSGINRGNVSPLNAIDPLDIARIEVLKDADATAIYGSRGANGVVLITTKKGRAGKTKVSASLSTTLGQVPRFMELMNTEQYLEVAREGVVNDGFGPFLDNPAFDFIWPSLKTWDQNRYTDWQKELIGGTAYRNKVQVSISGGTAQTQFLVSGNYQKETTVFPGDGNYQRVSGRSHLTHHSKDERFSISLSTNYSIEDNKLPRQDFTVLAYRLQPNAPALYDDNGDLNWEDSTWDNPLASLQQKYRAQSNTLIAQMNLSYRLANNLELRSNFGYTNNQMESYRVFPSMARRPNLNLDASSSSFDINRSSRDSWIIEPQLNWNQQYGQLTINVLLGSTFQKQREQNLVQTARGFSSNSLLLNLSAANTIEVFRDNNSDYNYQAVFGRINLNLRDKYILNLTGRRDGSSRFGPGKQFGNFGAVGLAWLFSEEGLFQNSTFLSFGKLRGSYGITGSDNIGDYRFLSTYSITGFDYNGISALEPTGVFNPNFGWESNKKLEVALELGFFNDAIRLNTAWYQNRSSNQLIGMPLAGTTGFNSLVANFDATVENTGLEIDFRTTNIQSKHFNWSSTFNLTVPKNRLVRFPDLENSAFANRYRIGEALTSIPLYQALGVDPDNGLYQFEDYNNDGNISALDDKQWFEDLAPEFYGGLGNTLSYKNLSLDFFFQFKKQKAFNYLNSGAMVGFRQNAPIQLLDRWQNPGDGNPIQRASGLARYPGVSEAEGFQRESNAAVSDASFIRLRNVSLTYKVPQSLSKGFDMSLYLQGQNLFVITDYEGPDPEQASFEILPPLRQVTLGLQLNF